MSLHLRLFAVVTLSAAAAIAARAQDLRTVTEPTFPAVCTQVPADLTISNGEPSSETNTATDTAAIQSALAGAISKCGAGTAVELTAGNGGANAFVISPIYIPAGVTLLVDGGVTVFGSRVASDYQIGGTAMTGATCGSTDGNNSCNPLITLGQSAVTTGGTASYVHTDGTATPVTGIMGYGVINGRGQDKLGTISGGTFTAGSASWWDNADGGNEDNPVLVMNYRVANTVLYKITLINSPHFHVRITGTGNLSGGKYPTNFTAWGLKLITPFSPHNTDGIDPTGANNVTLTNSIIGDGDDEIAISGSSASANFTFSNLLLPSGHGVSIGSITSAGVANVSASNLNFSGQAADGNQIALRIKSSCGSGGAVNNVTYAGVCMRNVATALDLDPYYATTTATASCPAFGTASAPITYSNVYIDTAGSNGSNVTLNPKINLQGLYTSQGSTTVTNLSNIVLNNLYENQTTPNFRVQQSNDTTHTPAYANITLNGTYFPTAFGTQANSTYGVTETVNGTTAASYPAAYCVNAYPQINGELYASVTANGATANNVNQATTVTAPSTVVLNAMIEPTNSTTTFSGGGLSYTGAALPTGSVQFYDGSTALGSPVAIGGNGTLATYTVANPAAGTHAYTARLTGDATYAPGGVTPVFGTNTNTGAQNGAGFVPTPLMLTVNAGAVSMLGFTSGPATPITYGTAPGAVQVATEDGSGNVNTVGSAIVTLTISGGGNMYRTTAATQNGVANFTISSNFPAGSYIYTATANGLTSATATETVNPATLTVTPANISRPYNAADPALTYTITGYVNGDSASVVTGAPALGDNATRTSPVGSYTITAAQGTLGTNSNYAFGYTTGMLAVTSGVPQAIIFPALPNFTSGGSYQLTARTTSGLGVTYSVSGPAAVSGNTLTVNAAGNITVTAQQPGNANYGAATSVSQSFTAQ